MLSHVLLFCPSKQNNVPLTSFNGPLERSLSVNVYGSLDSLGTFCRTFQEHPNDNEGTSGKRFLDVLWTLFKDVQRTHREHSRDVGVTTILAMLDVLLTTFSRLIWHLLLMLLLFLFVSVAVTCTRLILFYFLQAKRKTYSG